jgi:DNA-binding NarL/FixJ family response regulator
MKVLIADDSPLIRMNLRKLLSSVKTISTILVSQDVPSTIEQVTGAQPDIIILDIQMPGGTGFDVLQFIRERNLSITTIVLTNFASENNKKKSTELGAQYFFDKSNEYERILDVLNTVEQGGNYGG